eukprot:XP_020400943.1 skin secretory protein xP2-like [Zea mays]
MRQSGLVVSEEPVAEGTLTAEAEQIMVVEGSGNEDEEDYTILSPEKPSHLEFGRSTVTADDMVIMKKLGYFGEAKSKLVCFAGEEVVPEPKDDEPRTRGLILLRSLKPPLPLPDPSAALPERRPAGAPPSRTPPSRPARGRCRGLPDARAPSHHGGRPRPARGRRGGRPRPALRRRPCPTPARLATPPPRPALRRRPCPTPRAPSRAAAPARAAPPLPHAATAPGRARDAAPTHAPASSVPTPPPAHPSCAAP